jgi:hypothetical protein
MVLCVPGMLIVMVTLPALAGFSAAAAMQLLTHQGDSTWSAGGVLLMASGCLALSVAALVLRWIAFWSLTGSPGGELLARK